MAYTTAAEDAKRIRTELKAKGITSRQVSVRAKNFSMGSSVDVTIKDPNIKEADVKGIAKSAERISRCPVTHEILSGGNRYVSISYSLEALKVMADKVRPAVEAAIAQIHDNYLIKVEGTRFLVGRKNWSITIWDDEGFVCQATENSAAGTIGRRV